MLQQIDLSVLTGRPAMAAEESDPVHGVCVAGPKEVVMNLHNLMVRMYSVHQVLKGLACMWFSWVEKLLPRPRALLSPC